MFITYKLLRVGSRVGSKVVICLSVEDIEDQNLPHTFEVFKFDMSSFRMELEKQQWVLCIMLDRQTPAEQITVALIRIQKHSFSLANH